MRTHHARCTARTDDVPGFVDITDTVEATLADSGIRNGQVTVYAPDEGCSILINEHEAGLLHDLKTLLARLKDSWPRSIIGSRSVVLPALDGRLGLGMWQRVLLVELRDPGPRPVVVQVLGES